jgi:hypothetical protein
MGKESCFDLREASGTLNSLPCLAGSTPFKDLDNLGKASTIVEGFGTLQLRICMTSKGSYKLATPSMTSLEVFMMTKVFITPTTLTGSLPSALHLELDNFV